MSAVQVRFEIKNIQDARRALKDVGGDVVAVKDKFKEWGVAARDQKLLLSQLNSELNKSRKEALGIVKETKPLASQIKEGVLQAHFLGQAFAKVQAAVGEIKDVAGAKSFAEMVKDSITLEDRITGTAAAMGLTADETKRYTEALKAAAIASNIPAVKINEAVEKLQAKDTDLAKALITEDGGSALTELAKTTAASRSQNPTEGIYARGLLQKGLRIPAGQVAEAMEIVRAGEQKGAATAENITTQMGGSIVRHAMNRGFNLNDPKQAIAALREGQAVAQIIASGDGVEASDAATIYQNYEGHIGRSEVRKKFKEKLGVETLDKKTGKVRAYEDIVGDIEARLKSGKITPTALSDAATDEQFKRAIEIGLQSAKGGKDVRRTFAEIRDVDPATGRTQLNRGLQGVFSSTEGELQSTQRLAEARHLAELESRRNTITKAAAIDARMQTEHPLTYKAFDVVADILPAKWGQSLRAGAFATIASSDVESSTAQRERIAREAAERQGVQQDAGKSQPVVNVNVTVTEGMKAQVSSDAVTSKQRAKGAGKPAPMPGRSG